MSPSPSRSSRPFLNRLFPGPLLGSGWSLFLALLILATAFSGTPAEAKKKKKSEKGEINGTVESQDGESLSDITVTVLDAAGETTVAETVTDRKGKFEVEIDAPTGDYRVHFAGKGYAPFTGDVNLEPGHEQTLTVKLISEAAGKKNQAIAAYNEGAAAHRSGDLDTALARFLESTEMDSSLSPPLLGIADIHLQQGNAEAAVEAVEKYRALEPDDEQGKKVAFEAYRRAGLVEKTQELAEELGNPDMSKDLAIGLYNEGAAASQEGNYEVALAKFAEAAKVDPTLAAAHAGTASILYNQGQLDGAQAASEAALALEADNRQGLRIRYLALDAKGELTTADEAWEAYRAIDQAGAVDLLYRRADLDFQDGETGRAQAALNKVLELQPDFARAHYLLGLTYSGTDPAKAKEHLAKFIELAPDDPEAPSAKEIMQHL